MVVCAGQHNVTVVSAETEFKLAGVVSVQIYATNCVRRYTFKERVAEYCLRDGEYSSVWVGNLVDESLLSERMGRLVYLSSTRNKEETRPPFHRSRNRKAGSGSSPC